MQIKPKHLAALLLWLPTALCAQSEAGGSVRQLLVHTSAGEPSSFTLRVGDKLTFGEGQAVLHQGETTHPFALATLSKLTFTTTLPTSVHTAETATPSGILLRGNTLSAPGWNAPAGVTIHAASGQVVYRNAQWKGETVTLPTLPHGIYILKMHNTHLKFTR